MILPVHQRLRAAIAARLTEIYGLAPADQPVDCDRLRAQPRAGRSGRAGGLRTRPPTAQGAARDRAGTGGRAGHRWRASRASRPRPNGYLNCFLDRAAFLLARLQPQPPRAAGRPTRARPSSSTPPSTRTRRRTSATSATRRSATRWSACCASAAARSKCRTTSTTPASRSPTSSSGSRRSSRSRSTRCARWPRSRASTTTAGTSTRGSPSGTRPTRRGWRVRQQALHDIEHGGNPTAEMGALVADAIVRRHLETMRRLHIEYDLLTWEGDILRLKFWAHAFEILKRQGTVYFQTEGRLAGCWVMAIDDGESGEPGESAELGGGTRAASSSDEDAGREKVIVRSNGTVTYVGKDIAYQFWKFGLLGPGLQVPAVRHARRRPAALGDDVRCRARHAGPPAVWRRGHDLQRHRRAPVVPAETAEAGAGGHGPHAAGGALHPFLVRDGGAVARDGARARATRRRPTTSRSRLSRCPAARAWASRPTI